MLYNLKCSAVGQVYVNLGCQAKLIMSLSCSNESFVTQSLVSTRVYFVYRINIVFLCVCVSKLSQL